ncbi:MAG: 4Fe-4S binding protein [Firmicutes bacterium]|jgi:iron only hydrogenase large subunit-like protein|nr:4Fe-4S binding protein [Bacillota bacterium]
MKTRYHSVVLDEEKCQGCTNCIKNCPTEAIRVRGGKAVILTERCIDCGECIRTCENHAKKALSETLDDLKNFRYRVALPAPSLYGQFKQGVMPRAVLAALRQIGFDEVYEVAAAAELTTYAVRTYLEEYTRKNDRKNLPLISSSCPAVVRLIQVRFPGLIPRIIPVEPPYVTAAKMFYSERLPELGYSPEEIGLFFITPCPAKITEIKTVAQAGYHVDGAIPFLSIFGKLQEQLDSGEKIDVAPQSTGVGIGWARAGGESVAIKWDNSLSVDGIHHVAALLEEIEMDKLNDIDYIEAMACPEGCVGGALTVENPFVARVKIRKLAEAANDKELPPEVSALGADLYAQGFFHLRQDLPAIPALQLDKDLGVAIKKLEQVEGLMRKLPGLDCGACGSPTCRSLAEDIVQENAQLSDCIFILREELEELAGKLLLLSQKRPPALGQTGSEKEVVKGESEGSPGEDRGTDDYRGE